MNKKYINNKGITLIAMIVTIIVLIILAGISINLILGENGIITRAKEAKIEQEIAQITEQLELKKADVAIDNYDRVPIDNYIEKVEDNDEMLYKITRSRENR